MRCLMPGRVTPPNKGIPHPPSSSSLDVVAGQGSHLQPAVMARAAPFTLLVPRLFFAQFLLNVRSSASIKTVFSPYDSQFDLT